MRIHVVSNCFLFVTIVSALRTSGDAGKRPEEESSGYYPYHQLVATDFRLEDQAPAGNSIFTAGFFHYYYLSQCSSREGRVFARVTNWVVRSGFDRNRSYRKSWLGSVSQALLHEQGHLDINELHSNQFARLSLAELPVGEGSTIKKALADLDRRIHMLSEHTSAAAQHEQDSYDEETSHGADSENQMAATQRIHARMKKAGISFRN